MNDKTANKLVKAILIYSAVRYWETEAKNYSLTLRKSPKSIVKIAREFEEFVKE